jgi:hypothetical protein
MKSRTDSRKFKTMSRRELLKLTSVLALGAIAIPQLQKPLLKGGIAFSDWASARLFRSGHFAPTFADADLTPFEKFPINDYDVKRLARSAPASCEMMLSMSLKFNRFVGEPAGVGEQHRLRP